MKTYTLIATFMLAMAQFYSVYGATRSFNATFDTLTPTLEEGPISPVGTYLNISFTSFDFTQPNSAAAGLTPQSTPYYAYGAGSASNPAAMTILYRRSRVQSFALSSFYYGCVTNVARAPSVPVACTITATGYRASSSDPVAMQEFTFSPAEGSRAPLAFGTFEPAFQGLEHVTYAQSPAMGTLFFVDNVVGTIDA